MRLYPRLAQPTARRLFDDLDERPLEQLRSQSRFQHELAMWPATGASRIAETELGELRTRLRAVCDEYGYPVAVPSSQLGQLDRRLAQVLFESSHLVPAEAAFSEVWSFLALVLLPDVVWWRAAGSANVERYVASDLTRHTLARLWWRAYLFTEGLAQPEEGWRLWEESGIGEADLDQIQTRRSAYGGNPRAVRALVRVYPAVEEAGRRDFWRRDYLAWLLRLGAFVDFTALSEENLTADLAALAAERIGVAPTGT